MALSIIPLVALPLLVVGSAPTARADDNAPVRTIVAPVLDIEFGTSDLGGKTRVEKAPKKTTVTLDSTVLFGKDSAKINAKASSTIKTVASDLGKQGPGTISVTGYTDDLGSAKHGLVLSRQRAQAVAKVMRRSLAAKDFPFQVSGKGEKDPAVKNDSEAHRKINRRVVIQYQKQ